MSLLLATSGDIANGGVVEPEGIDFDGVTDYLSRSTDLVGNVDSKTFTFSCWVYISADTNTTIFRGVKSDLSKYPIVIQLSGTRLVFYGYFGTTQVLRFTSELNKICLNTYSNICISIDMNSTSNRSVYINDVLSAGTWNTYSNSLIDFSVANLFIAGADNNATSKIKGRLSNLYLDYTYRDLSIEANRRLFITADGKPTPTATLKALNPILYLPMKDAATATINEGTGGNFTLNGTIATSNRGANQDNCKMMTLSGSPQYLYKTVGGGASRPLATYSYVVRRTDSNTGGLISNDSGNYVYQKSDEVQIVFSDAGGTIKLNARIIGNFPLYKTSHVAFCIDMSAQSKCKAFIDGVQANIIFTTFIAGASIYPSLDTYIAYLGGSYLKVTIGELYFNTKYIDLSTSNPFWDSVANRPKPVRQVIAETGITPLIAMPLDASNAGKNYGTGGDFTANSAPYVGARGGSEFWARSARFDGSTGYLQKAVTDTIRTTESLVIAFSLTESPAAEKTIMCHGYDNYYIKYIDASTLKIYLEDSSGSPAIRVDISSATPNISGNGKWGILFLSFDTTNPSKRFAGIKIDGSGDPGFDRPDLISWTTYTGNPVGTNGYLWHEFGRYSSSYLAAEIGFVYRTHSYIDFSQEVNRNKFVDQLGFPKDLKAQIDAGVIPKPLIYLPFDEPTNLGKNLGTGGNFTVNGTVTQGADVNG